ncbi:MAG: regulatory protein RecX [Alphaproteobacteria bacterium]
MMKKPLKIPSPQSLANIALHYLGRYAASEASLRRVLTNRLRRVTMQNSEFAKDLERQQALRSVIETIIATHKRTGVINDAIFAETKVNSLRRQGRSRRAIQQKLSAKGIASETITTALSQNNDGAEPADIELKAAMALARKRKLGPFRKTLADADRSRKDFAALARAGFSSDIARRVLKTEAPDEWE